MNPPFIHQTAVIDHPFRLFQGGKSATGFDYHDGRFEHNVWIGPGAVVGKGVILERGVVVDSQCIIEPLVHIGKDTLLIYRAIIGCECHIGEGCIIGGLIAERCHIGNNCRVFGHFVHKQTDTSMPWDEHDQPEPSAEIRDNSFVGLGAIVVGGVTIGPDSYLAAGALVTKDVPPAHIASGTNRIIPIADWPGPLSLNPGMRERRA